MLLPIELFHVCVRYVSGSTSRISDIRRDPGTGPRPERTEQGRAGRESFRVGYVPARQPRASAARAPARAPAAVWLSLGTGSARLAGSASNVARGRRV